MPCSVVVLWFWCGCGVVLWYGVSSMVLYGVVMMMMTKLILRFAEDITPYHKQVARKDINKNWWFG